MPAARGPMSGDMEAGPPPSSCARCGSAPSPAANYLTEVGPLCWPCFGQFQTEQRQAEGHAADLELSLTRRAKTLAGVHWAMWSTTTILAVGWKAFPTWVGSALLLLIFGLAIGILLRRRWAYAVALVLAGAGILALCAWAIARRDALVLVVELFPIALLALTWTLRGAYTDPRPLAAGGETSGAASRVRRRRSLFLTLAVAALCAGVYLRHRPRSPSDPALELMRTTLPRWQLARAHGSGDSAGPAGELTTAARRWPALARAFEALDRAWPDEAAVGQAIASVNHALADAGLPYFVSAWTVQDRPYVLSYQLVARVPWQIGARAIDVLWLRRLDTINIDFAFDGVTQGGLPVVMLDRVEATLTRELPAMYPPVGERPDATLNDFDRAALARERSWLESRIGPALAPAALALGERNRRLEEMRTRLHGDGVQLAASDGFVLGDDWLDRLEPETHLDRPGGPLFLDTDLKAVVRADRALRGQPIADALRAAVVLRALSIEAHEARHAAENPDPSAPPPPALFEVMPRSSTSMIGLADSELQAFLGELHDAPAPVCVNLGGIMRTVYGRWARREPHFYATVALLKQLGVDADSDPMQQLSSLCAIPDGALRSRLAPIWQRLYGAAMPAGKR